MGIKTVPQPPYSPDLAPCDFSLFPKLRGCPYETIEEMKEAVTKVIDTLIQEDFHGATEKLLERYNKYIAAGGDYFEGGLSIKVPIRKKSGNLFNDPRIFLICQNFLNEFWCILFFFFYDFLICCPHLTTIKMRTTVRKITIKMIYFFVQVLFYGLPWDFLNNFCSWGNSEC